MENASEPDWISRRLPSIFGPMSLVEITRQRQRLDDLFQKAKNLPDAEAQSHWSRYLCVLVSGFLENSVRITYTEYARKRANSFVSLTL